MHARPRRRRYARRVTFSRSQRTGVAPNARIAASEFSERDIARTSWPSATKCRVAAPPTKPDAPVTKMRISRALDLRQRGAELRSGSARVLAPLAQFLDDLFRRLVDELGVAELGVHLADLAVELGDFLVRRAASAGRSTTPSSGSATVAPSSTNVTEPAGAASALVEYSSRAMRSIRSW